MGRVALDTNVLAYAEGVERAPADAEKVRQSRSLMSRLTAHDVRPVAPFQALAELHRLLVRRCRHTPSQASEVVEQWMARVDPVATSEEGLSAALSLAADHGLQIFDALILAAAAETMCSALLTEDLQDGFRWRGVEIINPFSAAATAKLGALLDE